MYIYLNIALPRRPQNMIDIFYLLSHSPVNVKLVHSEWRMIFQHLRIIDFFVIFATLNSKANELKKANYDGQERRRSPHDSHFRGNTFRE